MGPRPSDRGRRVSPPVCVSGTSALQWVHGLLTVGDKLQRLTAPRVIDQLQWVHGLLTVGDDNARVVPAQTKQASMGPRPSDRGRQNIQRHVSISIGCFNGSTAF